MNDEILLDLAINDHKSGRLDRAFVQYRQFLCGTPGSGEALYLLGMVDNQSGRHGAAARCFEKAVTVRPDVARFHFGLAEARRSVGDGLGARDALETALSLDPRDPEILNAHALLLRAEGRAEDALAAFDTALKADPGNTGLIYNRAMTLQIAGRLEEAVEGYEAVLVRDPGFLDARNNRAWAYQQLGHAAGSQRGFREVLATQPAYPIGWNNLGVGLREAGDLEGAKSAFTRSTMLDPVYVEGLNNLGVAAWALGEEDKAISSYRAALSHRPDLMDAAMNLASAYASQGRSDEAVGVYDDIERHHPGDGRVAFRKAFVLPQVYRDNEEIDRTRARIETFLDSRAATATAFSDPVMEAGSANFYLAYHGRNDRAVAEKIAGFYRRSCPRLSWNAPGIVAGGRRSGRGRPRLGICSKYLNRHTIGLLFEGVIARLAASSRFELVILRIPGRSDEVSARIDAVADHVVHLPSNLARAQETIAEADLDLLLYTDIGLEPLSYFLAFARLAPVQLVTWGHPVTTGLDSLDGYLSADAFEPEDGEAHYSEGLIRTRNIPMRYHPPAAAPDASKTEFGLPATGTAYVCPQNVFKLHPDYDEWLAGVLRADPSGRVVLIEAAMPAWTERLRARFAHVMPDVLDRVTFLPYLPTNQYFRLLSAADVILDPIHFGGGFTTFHALGFGKPVVTMRGAYQRSRFASGAYRLIGVEDLVATSRESYVELAVKVGRDPDLRRNLSHRIEQAAKTLQDNDASADELEALLFDQYERGV